MQRNTLRSVIFFLGVGIATAVCADPPSENFDFRGTWHLLVHYQDRAAEEPERWHWEDRVWVIESEGAALRWRDYPIVVFKDEAGRFEKSRGGFHRVLHAWEPNEKQEREIRSGLKVNDRGARSKRLELVSRADEASPTREAASAETSGQPEATVSTHATGAVAAPSTAESQDLAAAKRDLGVRALRDEPVRWASADAPAASSALVITYTERWSIREHSANRFPIFIWAAALESGLGEGVEGSTLFVVEEKSADGNEYRGRYEKDGNWVGRFRMRRSGPISQLGG